MAYYMVNRLDTPAYIPENYIHAFLLRDPHKSVYSLYKMSLNKDLTGTLLTVRITNRSRFYLYLYLYLSIDGLVKPCF